MPYLRYNILIFKLKRDHVLLQLLIFKLPVLLITPSMTFTLRSLFNIESITVTEDY